MLLIEVLGILIGAIVVPIVVPRKKGYKYNTLDKVGIATNVVLSLLYVPLSWAGITMLFFFDNPEVNVVQLVILYISVIMGISIPIMSMLSIASSVILRKRGFSKISFAVQFVPIALFVLAVLLLFSMALFNWI